MHSAQPQEADGFQRVAVTLGIKILMSIKQPERHLFVRQVEQLLEKQMRAMTSLMLGLI
jgi:hypothetical protein